MWPFDLSGPHFLVFYGAFGAVFVGIAALIRHLGEPEDTPKVNLSDPYLIAYLRGGKNEVLRVATMSLIDRKALIAVGTKVSPSSQSALELKVPVEKAVYGFFQYGSNAEKVFKECKIDAAARYYQTELIKQADAWTPGRESSPCASTGA